MNQKEKTLEKIKREFLRAKEELAIYKWANKKTRHGLDVFLREAEQEKKEIEETKAKDEAMLASIGDGLMVVGKEGKVIMVNKSFEEMVGWKQEEVIGKYAAEVAPREDEAGNRINNRMLSEILAGKKVTTTTTTTATATTVTLPIFYYVRKNKTRFPVSSIEAPVVVDGKIIGAVEVFHDITHEREIEKLRTDFLSLASHQLRTPLSGTKWLIETMQREVLGPVTQKQKEYLDQVYQVNERMIKLVFDMLHVLRFESGAVMVKKETVSISDFYKDLFITMETAAKSRGVILHNTLKNHKTFVVETDVTMLRSILECFVSNAINYSSSGQKVILDVKEESTALVFSIEDSGIGIPKEEQKRIFERFYRASNAKILKPDGTGLGLYISSMLSEKIGAEILFESEVGKGSTFYLRVPKQKMVDKNL